MRGNKGISPVIGVLLMIGVVVVLAASVFLLVGGFDAEGISDDNSVRENSFEIKENKRSLSIRKISGDGKKGKVVVGDTVVDSFDMSESSVEDVYYSEIFGDSATTGDKKKVSVVVGESVAKSHTVELKDDYSL